MSTRYKKPTIQELEALLNSEEETPIQILPNGEIRAVGQTNPAALGIKKPLTMKKGLGWEYGERHYGCYGIQK